MSKQQFSCKSCGQNFDSNDELQAHNNKAHSGGSAGSGSSSMQSGGSQSNNMNSSGSDTDNSSGYGDSKKQISQEEKE